MKIVYYIDSVIPSQKANTVHVMHMCQALAKEGADVTLVCDCENKNDDISSIWAQYGVEPCFAINRVFIPKRMRELGHRLITDYSSWKKAKLEIEADVAYSRSSTTLFFIRKNIRFIYEAHMEPDRITRILTSCIMKSPNCIGVVVISEALKKRYLELFPFYPEEKITVLHDAADIAISENVKKANLCGTPQEVKIGYLGHLYPGKCMEVILPLAEKCSQYYFHIVGGTDYWVDYWKKEVENRGINNVIFYGFVNNADVGSYYSAFDICVLPFSKKIHIGKNKRSDIGKWISPLKLFEAMAYKKAILVSNIDTIMEVMEDGVDCLTADPDNIDDWSSKLQSLVDDRSLRELLGNNAERKLSEEYTWQQRSKTVLRLISMKK